MVPLTESQLETLADIRAAWPEARIVLVGALALGHHIPLEHRHTDDMDLAVAVSLADYPGPLVEMPGWRRHPHQEQKYFSPSGDEIDVLPAGPELIERGHVLWPSGFRMSLVGFDLAFEHASELPLEIDGILVPDAPVLAFLKMRAWLDRPQRQKDLEDLAHRFVEYVGMDDDRRFADDVLALGLDFESVSPFLLGQDLGRIIESTHRAQVEAFLERAGPEQLAAHGPRSWFSLADVERDLQAFRDGIES